MVHQFDAFGKILNRLLEVGLGLVFLCEQLFSEFIFVVCLEKDKKKGENLHLFA
jgi:16S rRNA A1518/A1519 N6-dimethyltransferase RsmA/KsgA/DIM1 with predicted DNA glycosylase/AP lyase activity